MIATAQPRNDSYMRTGNVRYEMDVFGNAAAMDAYKFLTLLMSDRERFWRILRATAGRLKRCFCKRSSKFTMQMR
jgi:CRISPR-associated protein Csy1